MPLPKLLSSVSVCLLTLTLGATLGQAQTRARRASSRTPSTHALNVVGPRAVSVRPMRVQSVVAARPVRRPPVVRVAPGFFPVAPVVRRRPHGYRPGFSVGVYLGSPYYGPYRHAYRYPYPYAYRYLYPYPYAYRYPYPYPYSFPYPSPYPGPAYGSGAWVAYGGVRLEVAPGDATVDVDGYYVGIVDDFDGTLQRVPLEAGPHHFEIRAPGYETLAFDVNVLPNQIIRYRGALLPARP